MALIVEDGSGVVVAESFIDVAYFRSYHGARGTDVTGFTDEVIEQLCRKSYDYIVAVYGQRLICLPFPWKINYVVQPVPTALKQSQAELALISKTVPLMPMVKRGKKKVKVGPLEVEYDGEANTATLFLAASLRLAPLMASSMSSAMVKLVRC